MSHLLLKKNNYNLVYIEELKIYTFKNFLGLNYIGNFIYFVFFRNSFIYKNNLFLFFIKKEFLTFLRQIKKVFLIFLKGVFYELKLDGLGISFFKWKQNLLIDFGFSHYIFLYFPEIIIFKIFKTKLILYGFDKNILGYYINLLLNYKKYNNYKAKGLRKMSEIKILKIGKKR